MNLSTKILAGLIVGVVAGLVLGADGLAFANTWIAPLGTIFMNLIKMMIVPLVFSSLVVGVCGLGDIGKMGRIGGKTFCLYMATTFVAIAIGIFFGLLFQPGVGLDMSTEGLKVAAKQAPSLGKVLMDIFPSNPLVSMTKANMLQIIVFSLALGAGIVAAGEKAKVVADFFEGFAEACYKIIGYIMDLAPIGVFGLITPVIAKNGPAVLMPLIKIIAAVYLACAVHAIFVYGGLLSVSGINAVKYLKNVMPASLLAFTSCSSGGTLPVTLDCVRKMGISQGISSFVLPLGATINMDGTAAYQGVCALFVAQIYGVDLSFSQYAIIVITGTLASIGTAGVPGAGFIMLTLVLTALGLPLEGSALVAGIDRILDMPRTSVNVTGDSVVCALVAKSEGEEVNL